MDLRRPQDTEIQRGCGSALGRGAQASSYDSVVTEGKKENRTKKCRNQKILVSESQKKLVDPQKRFVSTLVRERETGRQVRLIVRDPPSYLRAAQTHIYLLLVAHSRLTQPAAQSYDYGQQSSYPRGERELASGCWWSARSSASPCS